MSGRRSIPKAVLALEETIAAAEAAWRSSVVHDLPALYRHLHVCATSSAGDAAAVTWYFLYWRGRRPAAIAPGRGSSLKVYVHASDDAPELYRVNDPADHRDGIAAV